jgi:hypothetical protein
MEYIALFLTALKELADRVRNLEKTRAQDKQDIFNNIVKPLFVELEPVSSNYKDFFERARQTIRECTSEDLRKTAQQIRNERDAMIMARIKVRETANQIKEHINDEAISEFATSVNNFFYSAPRLTPVRPRFQSSAMRFLDFLNYAASHNIDRQEIIDYLDIILENLERSWSSVVSSFERVKIKALSSQRFLHKP